MVSALVEVARLHLDLAGTEHVDAEKPAPLWVPVSKYRYERDGGVWALEYRSPLIDDDPDAGWWLYGPTCGTGIRFGSCGPALAQQRADLHIGEMVPARRRHRFDWWVKTSARDAFTCEAHGTVWFLVRNPAEAGPEPRPQRWRVYAVDGSAEMFLDRAPEDDEDAAKFAAEAEIRRRFGDDTAQDEVPF